MNDKVYCNHVQVPLDLLVGNASIPDRILVYLYLLQYDRWLDYGSLARVLGMTRAAVKSRCGELVADGRIERATGKARVLTAGLPDADPTRLKLHQGLCANKESKGAAHLIQVPLKVSRLALDKAHMACLKYRFTDEEFAFLQRQKAFTELQFWSRTLPAKCLSVGLTDDLQQEFPDRDAQELAVVLCVRGAMKYGRKISKLTGWILTLLPEWENQTNNLRAGIDWADRSHLPSLAARLGGNVRVVDGVSDIGIQLDELEEAA